MQVKTHKESNTIIKFFFSPTAVEWVMDISYFLKNIQLVLEQQSNQLDLCLGET